MLCTLNEVCEEGTDENCHTLCIKNMWRIYYFKHHISNSALTVLAILFYLFPVFLNHRYQCPHGEGHHDLPTEQKGGFGGHK